MIITEDEIERFFTGTCSDQEREDVARYFKEYPMEADKYFPELDWNDNSKWNEALAGHVSSRMLNEIHSTLAEKKTRRRALYYKIGSIAAIFLLFAGVYYFEHSQESAIQKIVVLQTPKVIIHSNKSIAIEHLILPDSTLVELYPQSTISYLANFEANKRGVQLKGEALFKVFKDAQRPFTVYSEQVSTTALGTCFRVKISIGEINIRLYEGKVLVKKTDGFEKELITKNGKLIVQKDSSTYDKDEYKRYYLNAGNEIVYHIPSNQFSPILNFLEPEDKKPLIVVSQSNRTITVTPPIIMNNVSMSSALDLLAEKFNVQIEYSPADVKDINIIATINPKQAIDQVLHNIAIMNNLRINKVDSQKFIITSMTK